MCIRDRNYYVYRYEGNLNGIENALVLLSYPEKAFGKPKALRAVSYTHLDVYKRQRPEWMMQHDTVHHTKVSDCYK